MWWLNLEWHVQAGLILSFIGVLVGVGAWVHAGVAASRAEKAKIKAETVEEKLDSFREDLNLELEQQRIITSTDPVSVEPANFVLTREGSLFWLKNLGPADAFNVQISTGNVLIALTGMTRWGRIDAGDKVEVFPRPNSGLLDTVDVNVSWELHAGGGRHHDGLSASVGRSMF